MDKKTSIQSCNHGTDSNSSNVSFLEALKAFFYPWIKEAAADAFREHQEREQKNYPERVTIAQASEITGYTRNSLYQMHSRGTIPGALKVGGKLLFDTATLQEWVRNGGVQD